MNRNITYREVILVLGIVVAVLASLILWVKLPANQTGDSNFSHSSLPLLDNAIKMAGEVILE